MISREPICRSSPSPCARICSPRLALEHIDCEVCAQLERAELSASTPRSGRSQLLGLDSTIEIHESTVGMSLDHRATRLAAAASPAAVS